LGPTGCAPQTYAHKTHALEMLDSALTTTKRGSESNGAEEQETLLRENVDNDVTPTQRRRPSLFLDPTRSPTQNISTGGENEAYQSGDTDERHHSAAALESSPVNFEDM